MSKDVENGSLGVVLAHFENIPSQKPLPAQTFAKKSTFWSRMKKPLIFCDFGRRKYFWDENIFETKNFQNFIFGMNDFGVGGGAGGSHPRVGSGR